MTVNSFMWMTVKKPRPQYPSTLIICEMIMTYDHFQYTDFDLYELLGDVHPPPSMEKRIDNKAEYESDASAGREYTYSSAKDVF
ncbi:MAG: hypothetical protein ACKPKO_34155, partial [Candidatus Fonsibacter sp.]